MCSSRCLQRDESDAGDGGDGAEFAESGVGDDAVDLHDRDG